MLEGELRAASDAGIAVAGSSTVSEGTIYGRYGFGLAVPAATVSVDTIRAGWGSLVPQAAVSYAPRAEIASAFAEAAGRTRRDGRIPAWPGRWQQFAGVHPSISDGEKVRGVVAREADGRIVGAMSYRLIEDASDYTKHTLKIAHVEAATADAYAALWRFALSHDLVTTVTADLQPIRRRTAMARRRSARDHSERKRSRLAAHPRPCRGRWRDALMRGRAPPPP